MAKKVESKNVRAHVWVKGKVQKVGFRANVEFYARQIGGITGWVRSVGYDTVEVVAEGALEKVENFVKKVMYEPPKASHVDDSFVDWEEPTGEFKAFVKTGTDRGSSYPIEKDDSAIPSQGSSASVNNLSKDSQPLEDRTPFHKDSPSTIDYLGRKGLAEALATWIDRLWTERQDEAKSFVINIHGEWGAGKTTFLNLLQHELKNNHHKQWIVVWFNAWENRFIKPEWWALLDKIYRDSVAQKKSMKEWVWHIKVQERWWRFYSGRKLELLGMLASSLLLVFIIFWVMNPGTSSDQDFMQRIEAVAKPIGLVLSALTTIFLGTRLVSQALINSGSARAAEIYAQFSQDPIEGIKQHFNKLIGKRIDKRVIVFIDDLDRCDRVYLVTLLETIQNLLNQQKVFYVIAADQRWLTTAFEETYKEFGESIKEPGKKLGYLFLEKIFQLSMPLPTLSDEVKAAYLGYLLGQKEQVEERREKMKGELGGIDTEQGLIDKIRLEQLGTIEKVIMRDAVVAKSASLEIEQATTHYLEKFAHLMESNPRALKRFATFYNVMRAIAILGDEEIISDLRRRDQFVLWLIVRTRWPLLADYLEEYPQHFKNFASGRSNKEIHPNVKNLVKSREVKEVLQGKGIKTRLDEDALNRFISLKATERTF